MKIILDVLAPPLGLSPTTIALPKTLQNSQDSFHALKNVKTRFTFHVPRWLEEVSDGDSVTAPRFMSNEKETNFKQNTFKHYTFF